MFKKLKNMLKKSPNKEEIKDEKNEIILATDTDLKIETKMSEDSLKTPYNLFLIHFAANLQRSIQDIGKLESVAQTILTPEGILDIPCVLKVKKETFYVFPFQESNLENANKYNSIKEYLQKNKKIKSIYFSPEELPKSKKKENPFRNICSDDFHGEKEKTLGKKTYAMWWNSKSNENYMGSQAQKCIFQIFKELDGIETYIFAAIGKNMGICDRETHRLKIPENLSIEIKGPEDETILFCISEEKGIRFKFDTKKISVEYRDNFLSSFLEYLKEWRSEAKKIKLKEDKAGEKSQGLGWYKFLEVSAKKENMQMIGVSMYAP